MAETELTSTHTHQTVRDDSEVASHSAPHDRLRARPWVTLFSRLAGVEVVSLLLFYGAVILYFGFTSSEFLTTSNVQDILSSVAVVGIVALGQCIAIVSGGFDLSVAGIVPLGSVCYAIFSNDGLSVLATTLAVVALGALFGAANGAVIAWLRINPLIATLAALSVTGGLAYALSNAQTFVLRSASAGVWGNNIVFGLQGGVVLLLGLALVFAIVLRLTVYGRSLYAVGGNREASRLAGIRVNGVTMSVYVISGACAALAGAVASGQLLAGSPTVGSETGLNSIAAVILGGASLAGGSGTIIGTIVGVLLLGTVSNGMSLLQVPTFSQEIVTGAILLAAVSFARVRVLITRRKANQ
jgi:ribose transport system permease protein